MHIKTLTIQGFKSYRDQTAVEEFSPGHNVVVGRNGSGKSNFFAAIRFVLSDAYTSLSRDERQALLHDSSASTSTTLSAFVEIVFDNSDGRFPSSSSSTDLVLRRTIGIKKDEYSIDRKSATKSDVMNLLEAAGFSRSNPYYIVPQGRITHLTNMKDADRLNLLKDVAGTKVYETRRADSVRILEETEDKMQNIMDSLNYYREKLEQLDEDRKELREYHDKDKERRALEYALLHQDSQALLQKLTDLDLRRASETRDAEEKQATFMEREKERKVLEDELANLHHASAVHNAEQEALLRERRELTVARAELEAAINDDEEQRGLATASKADLEKRLKELEAKIAEAEGELMGIQPEIESKMPELESQKVKLEELQARIDVLEGRQNRGLQYSSVEDRNAAINAQLQSLQSFLAQQESSKTSIREEIRSLNEQKQDVERLMEEKMTMLEERRTFLQNAAKTYDEVQNKETEVMEHKKELWKEQHSLQSSVAVAKENSSAAQKLLSGMMDRATATGLANVDAVTERLGLTGMYGPLYKLFSVDDAYKTAVEVTAGPSLFHVVVDTDETASKLIEIMNKEKLGRVTFMPLNRLSPKAPSFQEKADALLMIKKLRFDGQYKKALQQVFGRTIICPSLQVASSYVQSSSDINAITLDGDKVERKGAITGGYHDPKRNRLDVLQEVRRWQEMYSSNNARLRAIEQEVYEAEQEMTMLASERGQLETKAKRWHEAREPIQHEIRALRERQTSLHVRIAKSDEAIQRIERDLANGALKQEALRRELESPLTTKLTASELAELGRLRGEASDVERSVAELGASIQNITQRKEIVEIELESNLKRERNAIEAQIENLQSIAARLNVETSLNVSSSADLKHQKHRLAGLKAQLSDRQKSLEKVDRHLEKELARIKEINDALEDLKTEEYRDAKAIMRHEKVLNKILSKRRELEKRRSELEQKVRELGVIPSESLQAYVDKNSDWILKRLHTAQAGLKKFSNVNRRAIEQYDGFAKQRDQLLEREAELRKSEESIQELIDTLDMRKDEAIERTFKQVSRNFAEVFERLVPAGRGELKIQTRLDAQREGDEDEAEEESQESTAHRVENYVGVSIEVSFHSKDDEGLRIQQLSGGQKSLVALAIVFAIQKCDPAAFYLFDEIDANLDAQYRTSVAAMIQELSAGAQFITTTFRPELVGVGDKHYGVFFNDQKVSSLRPITQDDAYNFVEAAAEGV